MILKLKRTPGIYLVGFMGCGKSTVGHALADHLGWHFCDLDDEIERHAGKTIASIFDQQGEPEFRRMESETLKDCVRMVSRGRPNVISLGGGAFLSDANIELVTHNGVPIWLDCPFEMVQRRIAQQNHRPLARDPEQFRKLYDQRRASYQRAEYHIEVAGDDPRETVEKILALNLI
jgi:shikimate kinase